MGRNPTHTEKLNLTPSIIETGVLRSLIKCSAKVKLSSIDAQKTIYTHYDDFFNIKDHYSDKSSPLSLVEVAEAESLYGEETTLSIRAKRYIDLNIKKYLGLSFTDYIELPRSEQEILNKVCEDTLIKESKQKKEIMKDLEESMED